jgi:HSP20 family protein
MTTKALSRMTPSVPSVFENFFKPWNEWLQPAEWMDRVMTIPSVNIQEKKDEFSVTLAVPGMKKSDFKIELEGNQLIISSEKEETAENKEENYSRKEYNYSSFCRSFTLPDSVDAGKISANYRDGVLSLLLPKKEDAKKASVSKQIEVN